MESLFIYDWFCGPGSHVCMRQLLWRIELVWSVISYQLRIECMLLCEEALSVLEIMKPKVELVETACEGEYKPRLTAAA